MKSVSKENRIIFICWLAYAAAYVGRLNFAASIVAVVTDMGVTKAEAGLVSSFFFFAYGIGQLVNGILSKHYNSRLMVFLSLFISSGLNLALPLCGSISAMKYIWLVNGAVQSILWCTLIKTISQHVSDAKMSKAIVVMSTPTAAGTIIAYGLSSFFVKFANWRITFYVAAVVLLVSSFIWFALYGNEKDEKTVVTDNKQSNHVPSYMVMCLVLFAFVCIANGFLKDGINTWVSSVLYEEFGVSQSFSILLTLLMPMVSMVGATLVAKIHIKITSHSRMNLVFCSISAIMCMMILFSLKIHSVVLIMVSFVAVACLMSMVNNVVTSVFPLDCRKVLGSGFVSGLLNTFCYVGSTITSYSLGAVSQRGGWTPVFSIMFAVCTAAAVVSLAGIKAEKKEAAR